ncbi:Squalene synthase [Porphyridium purpureum]|uniref:squalene synthase n=1 Tax=Porphyridium purpureum TaxID=35688 RepID=A0A5J4YXY5_PORPP|nr:Squalene synthase [Porphyridium purpureum]|eukprot:POR6579..scf209_3
MGQMMKDVMASGWRVDEVLAMLRFKVKASRAGTAAQARRHAGAADAAAAAHWDFCYEYLKLVSRSFALVIMELDDELRDPVCIFYLVLRALDTIEDDTSHDAERRIALCKQFYTFLDVASEQNVAEVAFRSSEFGKLHEKVLLEKFPVVIECFRSLAPKYQSVIRDITQKMGAGMAEHIHDKECITVEEYDTYCFYVAGLVGLGLSEMFVVSGRESDFFTKNEHLSISMGLFLQKTNIIRDYLEDIHDARTFWPKEIWSAHAPNQSLADFKDPDNRVHAVECLNAMVADALRHVPDCIEYMSQVQNEHVFNFVAIPQVMAIGTISECLNNSLVFEGVVKLRKGLTAKLIMQTKSMPALSSLYFDFACVMQKKLESSDPSYELVCDRLSQVKDLSVAYMRTTPNLMVPNWVVAILSVLLSYYLVQRRRELDLEGLPHGGLPSGQDMLAMAGLFLGVAYMLGFFGLQFMKPSIMRTGSSENVGETVRSPRALLVR